MDQGKKDKITKACKVWLDDNITADEADFAAGFRHSEGGLSVGFIGGYMARDAEIGSHGPEGRNVTNQQYSDLRIERNRLIAALDLAYVQLSRPRGGLQDNTELETALYEVRETLKAVRS